MTGVQSALAAEPQDTVRTVADTRRACAVALQARGIESAELDARILVGHALGLDHAGLVAAAARRLEPAERAAVAAIMRRRLAREPVARIVGMKEFWGLPLQIAPAALVPRPETEIVVEAALVFVDAGGARTRPLRIADLGTGSGAILLALLSELPHAQGVGTDINADALSVARDNARRLGLRRRAGFTACNLATGLRGPFDLIVSNPPYIASAEIAGLAPEVSQYDPRTALDGGRDGLDFYRAIAAAAPELLAPGGAVIVELGAGQAESAVALFEAAGLAPAEPRPDLNGVPRALVVRKVRSGACSAGI